jgi:DNA helicase-2/ATP-dependent DNA helicase PcrA
MLSGFFRVLLPGCGPGTAAKLWNGWLKTGLSGNETPPETKWSDLFLKFKVPRKSAIHWEQLCYTLDELTPDGQFAKPSAMIFSILEGVYDDYLGATYDNADSRHSDLEKLSEYAGNFSDILEFLQHLSLMNFTPFQLSAFQLLPSRRSLPHLPDDLPRHSP